MRSPASSFRKWWRPPRAARDRDKHRSVTFLELFYDLVYVVVIAEIGHFLATHVTSTGLFEAAFLFVLVWIAWFNGSLYHDIHGHNDVRTRTFTFAQMLAVAAMAVFVHSAFGDGATGFALSYAAYQVIVAYLWWRTGHADPDHRPMSGPYSLAIFVSAAIFVASVFVPDTARTAMWSVALLISMSIGGVIYLIPIDPRLEAHRAESLRFTPSAVERFGLFTIIVLGEVIVGVVQGVAGHEHLTWTVAGTAALGMLVSIGLWWLYFDTVSHRKPIETLGRTFAWIYLHLATTMAIMASGAATLNVVEHAGEPLAGGVRTLLVGSVAVAAISIALTSWTVQFPGDHRSLFTRTATITLICGVVIGLLAATSLSTIPLLGMTVGLMLLPVFNGIRLWVTVLDAQDVQPHG